MSTSGARDGATDGARGGNGCIHWKGTTAAAGAATGDETALGADASANQSVTQITFLNTNAREAVSE